MLCVFFSLLHLLAGGNSSALVDSSGWVYMFGANNRGQLGFGNKDNYFVPTRNPFFCEKKLRVCDIQVGQTHSLAITHTNQLYVWGSADRGQLGLGAETTDDQLTPTLHPSCLFDPSCNHVVSISAGADATGVVVAPVPSPGRRPLMRRPVPVRSFQNSVFQRLLGKALQSKDAQPLVKYIYQIFSKPLSLNSSFLSGDNDIDAVAVEEVYKQFLRVSVDHPEILQVLTQAIQKAVSAMVNHLASTPDHDFSGGGFRVLPIILQCPLLSHATLRESILLTDISNTLTRLPKEARALIQTWWSRYPSEIFGSRLVRTMCKVISQRLKRLKSNAGLLDDIPDDVVCCVEVLNLLHGASNMATDLAGNRVQLVTPETFHLQNLVETVNLQHDFLRWLQPPPTRSQLPPFALCRYPFLLCPATKNRILKTEFHIEMTQTVIEQVNRHADPVTRLKIRRANIVESALYALGALTPQQLKRPLFVSFEQEEGIDEGGVTREFFQILVKELVNPQMGLFEFNNEIRTLGFNLSPPTEFKLQLYNLAGIIVGLVCYHAVSVHVNFPLALFRKLLNQKPTLDDLKQDDPVLARSLEQLLTYEGDVEETFGLNFQVTVDGRDPLDLLPNGGDLLVTNQNRDRYVQLYLDYRLEKSAHRQVGAFCDGFKLICNGFAMNLFTAKDLELMICGSPHLDFKALQANARYEGFEDGSEVVQWFWDIVHSDLNMEQRRQLLRFTTG